MKKIYGFLFLLALLAFKSTLYAQTCASVNVATFPLDPQSGSHNYFGVRVTLVQTYSSDVTVTGYVYDEGNGSNTNHPYTLTITSGNLIAETEANFYETDATASAVASTSSISPCPATADASTEMLVFTNAANFVITKIAASGLTSTQIASATSDSFFVTAGIFTYSQVDSLNTVIQAARTSMASKLDITGSETCIDCTPSYSTRVAKIASLVTSLRNDAASYNAANNSFFYDLSQAARLAPMDDNSGPNCKWAFYICTYGCTGMTSGLGAAICVYVCACSFCQVKPWGC